MGSWQNEEKALAAQMWRELGRARLRKVLGWSVIHDVTTKKGMNAAVRWQIALMKKMQDGGTWFVPRSGGMYRVYPSRKKFEVIMYGEKVINSVFYAMGWTQIKPRRSK